MSSFFLLCSGPWPKPSEKGRKLTDGKGILQDIVAVVEALSTPQKPREAQDRSLHCEDGRPAAQKIQPLGWLRLASGLANPFSYHGCCSREPRSWYHDACDLFLTGDTLKAMISLRTIRRYFGTADAPFSLLSTPGSAALPPAKHMQRKMEVLQSCLLVVGFCRTASRIPSYCTYQICKARSSFSVCTGQCELEQAGGRRWNNGQRA